LETSFIIIAVKPGRSRPGYKAKIGFSVILMKDVDQIETHITYRPKIDKTFLLEGYRSDKRDPI